MDWSQMPRGVVVLLAIVTVVGMAAAPVAAVDDDVTAVTDGDDGETDDTAASNETTETNETQLVDSGEANAFPADGTSEAGGDGTELTDTGAEAGPVTTPEADAGTSATAAEGGSTEIACTDVTAAVGEQVPYDRVIWVDDLPERLQPEQVPWTVVTPRAIGAIVVGATPSQCDVFDPTDPPYDPREDDVDPDGGADVAQTDEGSTLIVVNGTLNRSADGPGGEAAIEVDGDANGAVDPTVTVDDGEKDYAVDPRVQYWEDGTVYLENGVTVIGKRAGVEVDCNGDTCDVDVQGAPKLVEYPSVPSHSDADHLGDGTDGGSVGGLSTTAGSTGLPLSSGDPTAGPGGDGGGADTAGTGASDDGSGGGGAAGGDGSGGADGSAATTSDGSDQSDERSALAGLLGGPGIGLGLAGLGFIFTTMVARGRPV